MEQFMARLDTLLDNDPFDRIDRNLLSHHDTDLLEQYRAKHVAERARLREERQTKTFEQIMEDLLQQMSIKPDLSAFYRTLDEPLATTSSRLDQQNSIHRDVRTIELDTSADEQDDLEHCATTIDPTKSIGHSTDAHALQASTYVLYPLTKSPSVPPPSRKTLRYADQTRRNTYTIAGSSSSSDTDEQPLINAKPDCVRLDSQGFEPQQQQHPANLFNQVQDARSTFSIPRKTHRFTHQEAQRILHRNLSAFVKGHLTRQVFRTDHVQRLLQTLHDTRKFAVDFQTTCLQTKRKLDPEDINTIDQLIQQVEAVLNEIHAIFEEYPPARRILMIIRHEQSHPMRTAHQRSTKHAAADIVHRPIIDSLPARATKSTGAATVRHPPSDYQRPVNIRRHVSAVPNRPVPSTSNVRPRPLTKATSVQRKSRPFNPTDHPSTSNPPRSSSANTSSSNNANKHVLRATPASPLFRNRFK